MKLKRFRTNEYSLLFYRLLLILLALSLSRFFLYFFNIQHFSGLDLRDLIYVYFIGLRFDLSVLMMISAPLILISLFPYPFKHKESWSRYLLYLTILFSSLAIIANSIDAIYFRFTLKRTGSEIFSFLDANVGFFDVFKALIADYWFIFLLDALLILLLIFAILKAKKKIEIDEPKLKQIFLRSLLYLLFLSLTIIGMRGGLQLKPINIIDASTHVKSTQVPLVLNTTFSLIVTRGQAHLQEENWLSKEDAQRFYPSVHRYSQDSISMNKKNIVVLILESFSASKVGYFHPENNYSLTPFLDSLLSKSLCYKGFANGKKSIEGIPALLSGIPTLMREPFLTSAYASNQFTSIAAVMNKHGYQTAFFHGGKNGTMNFDSYAQKVGFQEYFGLNEYPNKGDYDGSWGIWDHRFYPFFKMKLDHFKQPFLAAFFSLSSHHPYAIPEEYKKRFQQKKAIDRALAYSDFSLSLFFKEAKKSPWFKNTVFVLSADHSAELPGTYDSTNRVFFEIPIAIFSPGDSLLRQKPHRKVMQQSDVFPTLMDYLNYSDSFIAFGNSIFDLQAPDFALYYLNGVYHGQSADYDFDFDGNTFTFTPKTFQQEDSLKQQVLKQKVKAEIQNYNRRLLYNQLIQENR